jgi:hypothetical protein
MLTTATLLKSDGVSLSQAIPENFPNLSQMRVCCRATLNFFASRVHEIMKNISPPMTFRFATIDQGKHFLWPPETERVIRNSPEYVIRQCTENVPGSRPGCRKDAARPRGPPRPGTR